MKKIFLIIPMFFLTLVSLGKIIQKQQKVVAIVIPHHNFVKNKREEYLQKIKKNQPGIKKIIIIGPDHFSTLQTGMSYCNTDWSLYNGKLDFDKEVETTLGPILTTNNNLVKNDHTIFNLVPEVKEIWPKATIFPVILGQKIPLTNLNNLIEKINLVCGDDCLLIASVDFSHYLPAAIAEVHDTKSIRALENLEINEVSKLEVDSQQSLYVLMEFAKSKSADIWNLFSYTNSGAMANDWDMETTSHVMGGYRRGLSLFKSPQPYTFMISKNTNINRDKNTLGERFFYGIDGVNVDVIHYKIPQNMAVFGVKKGKNTKLVFAPLEMKDGAMYLLRGEKKIQELENFLGKKHLGGIINYEQRNNQRN